MLILNLLLVKLFINLINEKINKQIDRYLNIHINFFYMMITTIPTKKLFYPNNRKYGKK